MAAGFTQGVHTPQSDVEKGPLRLTQSNPAIGFAATITKNCRKDVPWTVNVDILGSLKLMLAFNEKG